MKRAFEIVVSLTAMIMLAPVFLGVAIAVAIMIGRPVFFMQQRPGLHGKPFRLIKFRTMTEQYDQDGELLPDKQRLPPFGRWLRATSLDELPELWNVLRGDMSLVGPRPLLMEYLDLYTVEQARRHEVRPGITGWAQVNGRNAVSWKRRLEMDCWYVDHRSFWLDLKILWKTVCTVFQRDGISQPGQATMERFQGNDSP